MLSELRNGYVKRFLSSRQRKTPLEVVFQAANETSWMG
jgi:hypothetical protein